ncbi:D-methionine-binding lipoprotein MetQ precursor [compost metagenome]
MTGFALRWLTIALLAVGLTSPASAAPPKRDLTIGTSVGDFGDMVKLQIKPALERRGYRVKLVEFSDYVSPNIALSEGSLDVNVFQHKPYLDDFSRMRRLTLSPVFQVPTAPLGLYAGKLKRLDQAKPGIKVAIPNDATNLARSLRLLQDIGWLTLRPGVDELQASTRDIATSRVKVSLVQLEAAQIPRALRDVDFAVVNGNYAVSSGLRLTDALAHETGDRFVNWGVVRSGDRNAPWVKDVIAAYQAPEFKRWAKARYLGYRFPEAWR